MTSKRNGGNDTEPNRNPKLQRKLVNQRLDRRRTDGESRLDVTERLLDESVEEVPLRTIIDDVLEHYSYVGEIIVEHREPEYPSLLGITVYTDEADGYVDTVPLYESGRYRAVIGSESQLQFKLPFYLVASMAGPPISGDFTLTILYRDEDLSPIGPHTVEEGIERISKKLGKSPEEIREYLKKVY